MPGTTNHIKDQLAQGDEIQITVLGRKSGQKSSRPVWFVLEGNTLYLLPVQGSDTGWYKNVLHDHRIWISAGKGTEKEVAGSAVTDPKEVTRIADKFRKKHGEADVKKYYSKFDAAIAAKLD